MTFFWLNGLFRLAFFPCAGSQKVPGEVHAVIVEQIQPDEWLIQLNRLKPDNAANQLKEIQVDIQPIKPDNLLIVAVLGRQVQGLNTQCKRVAVDLADLRLPAHLLHQLIGQSAL